MTDLGQRLGSGERFLDGPLPAGTYEYLAVAEGSTGARSAPLSSGPILALDDATPPAARIFIAGNRPATSQRAISIQFTDLTEPVVEMRFAESLDELSAAPWAPYQMETTFTLGPGDGLHEVFAQVRDAAGLASSAAQGIIQLDSTAPSSAVGSLPSTTATASIDIPFTTADSDGSGVDTVELWARSRTAPLAEWGAWAVAAIASASPIPYTLADSGEYEFDTVAIDAAGNREAAPAIADAATRFDQTAPETHLGTLEPTYSSPAISIPYTASDALSGVASVELWSRFRATSADPWAVWSLAGTASVSPIAFTFGSGPGLYEFYTIGIDEAGNREAPPTSADASTTYEAGQPPDVQIASATARFLLPPPCNPFCPLAPAEGTLVLTATGNAMADTGVVSVDYRLWGIPPTGESTLLVDWTAATATDGAFDSTTEGFRVGDNRDNAGYVAYGLDIRATAAGSSTTVSQQVPFEHDTVAPTSSINPLPTNTSTSPYPISATATDNWPPPNQIKVESWYRFRSKTNQPWGAWTQWSFLPDGSPPYVISFTFPNGKGYYEFYSIATDQSGNREAPPPSADAWIQKR